MRKLKSIIWISMFAVIFSAMPIRHAKAASGDFYNVTKKAKYNRADLISNKALAQQLQTEMDAGDVIAKELSGGKVIDYGTASNLFISLLKTMTSQQALVSAVSSQNVNVDRTATGIDNFNNASLDEVFDVIDIQ